MIVSVFEFSHNLVITGCTNKDILPYKKNNVNASGETRTMFIDLLHVPNTYRG